MLFIDLLKIAVTADFAVCGIRAKRVNNLIRANAD